MTNTIKLSLIALLAGTLASQAATDTWTGANSADWSDSGNWNPGLPGTGDTLLFDASGQTAPNNDNFAGGNFGGITFTPTGAQYVLGGTNSITLDTALVVNSNTVLQTISFPVVLANGVTFDTVSNLDTSVGDIEVAGAVSGTGSLTKNGGGTLTLANGSYAGGTLIDGGLLVVSNTTGAYTNNGGGLMLNFRTYYTGLNVPFTADSAVGVDLLDNAEPVGVDDAGTLGSSSYKLTKIGQGLLRIVQTGVINASTIDVAAGTLASLGGGIGGSVSVEPLHKLGTSPITVENGAMLRIDDGGVVQNAITLNGGDGTSVGGSTHTGALRSSARNNGGSTTNFNYFTNTITLASSSTIGCYYNTTFISGDITGPGSLTKIGNSPLLLSGSNSFSGTLNIGLATVSSGGTLKIGSANAFPAGASVYVNQGSTLDLNGTNAVIGGVFQDDASALGIVDNSSVNAASLGLNGAYYFGQVKNTGGGPLSIINVSGTGQLLGANSYTGANIVQAGTLEINIPTGTTTGGLVQIADNAILTLNKTTTGSSLKASGATIGTNTTLNISLNNYGNSSAAIINATNGTGVLAANGTLTVNFLNTANLSVGTFPIIRYTTRTGTGNFVLTPISGVTAKIVTNTAAGNNYIGLQITGAPITTWKGTTNNLWDTTTTNWTYNSSPVLYSDGSAVYFDDTALTNNVNLTTALSPGSVLFNSSSNYIFGGTGPLNGGALTKNGSGTLILDVKGNGYASTTIGAGTLQVGNNDNNGDLGSGPVDDEAILSFNLTNNYTVPGVISGAGAVVKNNTNIITLSQANTYSGGTTVNQGVLKMGNNTALGVTAGSVLATVASGASVDLGGKQLSGSGYVVINGSGIDVNTSPIMTTSGGGLGVTPQIGLRFLRLAGNSIIGDNTGSYAIGTDPNANGNSASVGSIDGQGYSLTKIGSSQLLLDATNATALSQFTIASGGVLWANTGISPIGTTCPIVISNNTYIQAWDNYNNSGISIPNSITVGAGGCQLLNNKNPYYGHAYYNTFSGAFTLNANLSMLNTSAYGGAPNNVATSGTMTFSGPISGTGGIICTNGNLYTVGSSTSINSITFSGANTYSGPTLVNGGVLQLSSIQQGGGSYSVYDNSTMDVPTQVGYSNVPMSSLTLGSVNGGTVNLGRVTALSTLNAPIMATNLTVIGTNSLLLPSAAYASAPGEYPLIKYVTGPSGYGTTSLIAIGGGVRGVPGYITNDTANSQIALVIPGGTPVVWTGTNSLGNWDIATSLNWATNATATTYQQTGSSLGDAVTFNDSSTQTNVNVTVPVAPTAAIFNITNTTYTLFGTNLTGAASLMKNGSGTLILSNRNNNFTGGTFVGAGTLKMAYTPTAQLNNLSGTATVASGATLDMGSNNPTALTVNISGSGVGGNGALQGNYSGNAVAIGPSAVNLLANATIGSNNRWDIRSGSLKLSAANPNTTLTKVGSGYVGLVGVNVSTNIGDIFILNGTLDFQTSSTGVGDTTKTIYVGNGGALGMYQFAAPIYKSIVCSNNASILADGGNQLGWNVLAGPVKLDSGTTTFRANAGFNGIYVSNNISGSGALSIQYQTYLYLAASNSFTGQLTVGNCNASNGGRGTRLSFIGNGSAMTCSQIYLQGIASGQAYAGWISMDTPGGILTLGANQQLRGDNGAYVRGSVVAPAGSSLAVGQVGSTNYQYMIIGTNLTLQGGSTNYMEIYKAATLTTNSQLYVSNSLALGGTLKIQAGGPTALAAGDTFKLFSAGAYSGAFAVISTNVGSQFVTWNTSQLAVNGTLTVASATANNVTNLTSQVSGSTNLVLSWPADHIGWSLQVQTNSTSIGISNNWVTVPGSTSVNIVTNGLDQNNGSVFYRLTYP